MRAGQEANGHVPPVAPSPHWGNWGQPGSGCSTPWWGGAMIYGPWQLYQFTGDDALLRELYPGMKALVDFMQKTSNNLILGWCLGDWGDAGSIGSSRHTPVNHTNTCGFYYVTTIVAQIAEIIGNTDDVTKYTKLANDIRDSFNKHYLDVNTGNYGGSQACYALPLLLGMAPEECKDKVVQNLVKQVNIKNNHLSTGMVGTIPLMKALSDNGQV